MNNLQITAFKLGASANYRVFLFYIIIDIKVLESTILANAKIAIRDVFTRACKIRGSTPRRF